MIQQNIWQTTNSRDKSSEGQHAGMKGLFWILLEDRASLLLDSTWGAAWTFKPHVTTMCLKHFKKKNQALRVLRAHRLFLAFSEPPKVRRGNSRALTGVFLNPFTIHPTPSSNTRLVLVEIFISRRSRLHYYPSGSQEGDKPPTPNMNTKETQAGVVSVWSQPNLTCLNGLMRKRSHNPAGKTSHECDVFK